jgi:hypothetical protein
MADETSLTVTLRLDDLIATISDRREDAHEGGDGVLTDLGLQPAAARQEVTRILDGK